MYVTYAFQSESALYSFLNVKECNIWKLSDSNEFQTHNHLVRKQTLKHLAQLASQMHHKATYSQRTSII